MSPAKRRERQEARKLRRVDGMPIKEIATRLGVSPASVHAWTRDIEISEEHRQRNLCAARAAFARRWAEINSLDQIERWWSEVIPLPKACFRNYVIDHYPTSSSGRERNKLPYGVCSLRLCDTRIVQHVYGGFEEYADFEEPWWLDGPPRKPRPKSKAA